MGVEFGAATQYSIELSRNVKRGLLSKVKSGWRPGQAPLGYQNSGNELKGQRTIYPDPERFSLLKDMWMLLLDGQLSVPQIQRKANTEWKFITPWNKPLARTTLYKIFTNPFYAGMFLYNGQLWQGKHKPMITLEQYDRAQLILVNKGKPRAQKYVPTPFAGMLVCGECGYSITAEPPKTKTNTKTGQVRTYHYLRCTKKHPTVPCVQRYIRKEQLDTQIEEMLLSLQVSPAFVEWALDELLKTPKSERQQTSIKKKVLTDKLNTITAQMRTLNTKLIAQVIDDATYTTMRNELITQKTKLEATAEKLGKDRSSNFSQIKELFCFARDVAKSYRNSSAEEKRIVLNKIGSNFSLKDRKLSVELRKPFLPLKKLVSSLHRQKHSLEPSSSRSKTGVNEDDEVGCSMWRRTLTEVRKIMSM